jgi:hypothetical protein
MVENLGSYIVRDGNGEKIIHAPSNVYGKFDLVLHEDGHFSYYPCDKQSPVPATRYVVKDPKNVIDPISFKDEKKASEWKDKMERETGRAFRMEKIFNSSGIKPLGE